MFVRRSGRLNPDFSSNQGPRPNKPHMNPRFSGYPSREQLRYQRDLREQEFQQQRYFNNSQINKLAQNEKKEPEPPKEIVEEKKQPQSETKDTSATTKALNQIDLEESEKKRWKKGVKMPLGLRRKKMNKRLSKLLTPKSALILLHELKPGCVYKIQTQQGCIPPSFLAQVEFKEEVLGTGQGLSKSQAKNSAAENAIKSIVSRTMSRPPPAPKEGGNGNVEVGDDDEDTPENLPWAGLASFAIYKMFSEWQSQGADLHSVTRPAIKTKIKASTVNAPTKKDLPPNATELHPAVVLNMVKPGLIAVELEREDGPKCRVKMGYDVDGQMFTGVGGNKKDAKKEAAKAVLESLYDLKYP